MVVTDCPSRLGTLSATPGFLAVVPRPAMVRALRAHQYAEARDGEPFESRHSFEGATFRLRTSADRTATHIRLDGEA